MAGTFTGIAVVSGLTSVLIGSPSSFLRLIDVIQEIRYLQLINLQYPKRVDWFFDLFENFDFKFFPKIIKIEVPEIDNRMLAPYVFQ